MALTQGGLHRGHHAILVFGMQRIDEEVVIRAHIQRPAVNTIDLVRPPYLAGDEIEFPITHRGDALCLFQTMLTLHHRLLHRPRELMHARLARLAFADIGETHHRSVHLVLLAYRCKTAFDLHGAAVAVPKHHLVPNVGAQSLTCTDETIFRTYRAALRGMAVYQLVQGPAEELVGSIAQQAGAGIIDERAAAFAIHAVYTLGGGFEQQADVSVEFGVLRLHAVLRGDVGDESLEPLQGTALVPDRDTLLPSQFFGAVLCAQAIMQAIRRTRGNRVLHFIPKTLAVVGVYQLHEAQMPIVQ